MKTLLLILTLFFISCGQSAVKTSPSTPSQTTSATVKNSDSKGKAIREKFIADTKDEIAKKGVFITASGADSEIMNVSSRLSVSESEKLMREGLDGFREIGFKQIVISGKDGIKNIDLENVNKQ